LSSEPKSYKRVGNNGTCSIPIGEQSQKTLGNKGKGKSIRVKQRASTDNCGNKGTQANVEGNEDPQYEGICVLYV